MTFVTAALVFQFATRLLSWVASTSCGELPFAAAGHGAAAS